MLSILNSSSSPPFDVTLKHGKTSETLTPYIQAIDLDEFEFEFDEVILKDAVMLDISVTYFDEGFFGWPNLMRHLFSHFGSDIEWTTIREAHKKEEVSNGKMMADHLIKVKKLFTLKFHLTFIFCSYFTCIF